MKKLFSAIASIATAVLTFVFLSIPCLTYNTALTENGYTGWQMLGDEGVTNIIAEIDGYTLFKIFAIIAMVVACLLVITGLITLLQQFGIVKSKMNFCLINSILLALFTIVALVAMIGAITIGSKLSNETLKIASGVGVGLILMFVIGIIATVISFVFARQKK